MVINTLTSGNANKVVRHHQTIDSPVIRRAVVYEVLDNVSLDREERLDSFEIVNIEDLDIAPRNSVIVKYISGGQGKSETSTVVCFPFFSSHMSLPIKVGEQIWIILEFQDNSGVRGYWLSRIHEPVFVEDANYTHGDRRENKTTKKENFDLDEDGTKIPLSNIPSFQNGKYVFMDDPDSFTLGEKDEYEKIYSESLEGNSFVIEPVPRYTKRPGDMVLQGSHNATIVLGTDRGYTAKDTIDREKSNAALDEKLEHGKGSIDLVVGRGRIHATLDALDGKDLRNKVPARTEPRIIKTISGSLEGAREVFETDKNISVVDETKFSNITTDACEGDPDFINDSSRIYLTMKSDPEEDFSLTYPLCPLAGDSNAGVEIKPAIDAATIVLKSDEVRIVARQVGIPAQLSAEPEGDNVPAKIAGSIKIIKEGILDDETGKGQASIILQQDGVIMIDGPKIVLGSGIEKENGEGAQISLGLNATEPLVLGDMLKKKLEAYMDAVSSAFEFAATHVHPTGTGPSGPPTGEQWSAKKSSIDTTKSELSEILSKIAKTL